MDLALPFVTSFIENDVVTVAFADDESAPTKSLMLTRMLHPSDDDLAIDGGMPGLTLDSPDGQECYGEIMRINLQEGRVELVLGEQFARDLEIYDNITIRYRHDAIKTLN